MLSADNVKLSDNMLSIKKMLSADNVMLSDNTLSYFFSWKLHTLGESWKYVAEILIGESY
jgi:hypothetical protein